VSVESFAPVFPVPDLAAAVTFWTAVLGVAPTFVDGERWAQFDAGGRRLALAGTDRVSETAGVMVKTADIDAASSALESLGARPGPVERGPHELRRVVEAPGGWSLVLYTPVPS
jgi:catechol 2,3-dioxygenase-like lactoylglutathione lyase family enzyme